MHPSATRWLAFSALTLALLAGTPPAHAAAPAEVAASQGWLCKIIKIHCP